MPFCRNGITAQAEFQRPAGIQIARSFPDSVIPGKRRWKGKEVRSTRIGVHDVIGLLQNAETVDSIVTRCFPNITRAQVYECLAYYEDHRGEIDVLVARQMAAPTL